MILWLFLFTSSLWAKDISLMSLNLHGFHPMGEERRVLIKTDGTKELAWAHLHYFTESEIRRGLQKRQALLSTHIQSTHPDILFLQEVGGAEFNLNKTCTDFYRSNTAQDLKFRLPDYQLFTGCRGNVGWWTDQNTFNGIKIVSEKTQSLIMSQGANPYPQGMMVEGLAILTSGNIKVISHVRESLKINNENETFFFHMLKFGLTQNNNGDWWLAVNIHGGHMIQNFEQAVTTRRYLSQYLDQQPDKAKFQGFVVAGDFNAQLPKIEISTVPWSFFHAWQTKEGISADLLKLNASDYKPWSRLSADKAQSRVRASVDKLFDWFSWPRHTLDGSLNEVSLNSPCVPGPSLLNPFCQMKEKIDHIFVSDTVKVKNHSALYKQNNWTDLNNTMTDHPGFMAIISL